MRRLLDRLGQPESFSWQVAALSFIPALLVLVLRDWAPYGGSLAMWMLVMVVAQAVAIGCMVPLRLTVLGRGPRPSRPWLTLAAFVLAGGIRSGLIELLANAAGLPPTRGMAYRLTAGPAVALAALATIALIFQTVTSHRRAMHALEARRRALTASRETGEEELRRTVEQARERVRATLGAQLRELGVSIERQGGDEATRLLTLLDTTLKPLATQLVDEPLEVVIHAEPRNATALPVRQGEGIGEILQDATLTRPLLPPLTSLLSTVFGAIMIAPELGPLRALPSALAGGAVVLAVLLAANRFVLGWLPRRGPLLRSLVLTLVLASAAAAGIVVLVAVAGDLAKMRGFMPTAVIAICLLGWTLAMEAAWQRRAAVINRETESAVESLELAVRRLNARARAEQDRFARLIHGPVQDRLLAARMLLPPSSDSLPSAAALAEAAELLREARNLLELPPATTPQIAALVEQFAAIWEDIVDVRATIDEDAAQALDHDDHATTVVAEIIREAIANAVRHSGTRSVRIGVHLQAPGGLEVTVDSDGVPEHHPARGRRGLGTRILDAETDDWSLERTPAGTRLRASVAVGATAG